MTATVGELNVKINADTSRFNNALNSTESKLNAIGPKISSIGSAFFKSVTLPIIGAGTASIKLASDMEETANKVDVAFGDMSDGVNEWANDSIKRMGLARETALASASGFKLMANGMEIANEAGTEMATMLTQRSADLASLFNTTQEMAETALAGIYTNEGEALKKYGAVMTESNLKAFALAQGIEKSYESMTEAEKVTLRYNFVMAKTAQAEGDRLKTGGSAANQMKEFKEILKEVGTVIGTVLLPMFTQILGKINEFARRLAEADPEKIQFAVKLAGITAAIGPVLMVVGKLLIVLPKIKAGFMAVKAAMAAISGPVGLIIAGIAALVAGFIYLYKNNEDFKNKIDAIWVKIKEIIQIAVEQIQAFWAEHGEAIKQTIQAAWDVIYSIITIALDIISGVLDVGLALIQGDWEGAWEAIKNIFVNVWNGIKELFNNYIEYIKTVWYNFGWDLKNKIVVALQNIRIRTLNFFINIRNKIVEKMKEIKADIVDPIAALPETLKEKGKEIIQNLVDGILEKAGAVWDAVTSIGDNILGALGDKIGIDLSGGLSNVGNLISGMFDRGDDTSTTTKTTYNTYNTTYQAATYGNDKTNMTDLTNKMRRAFG